MATKSNDDLVIATQGVYLGEELGHVRRGEVLRADDPIVQKYPTMFVRVADRMRIR